MDPARHRLLARVVRGAHLQRGEGHLRIDPALEICPHPTGESGNLPAHPVSSRYVTNYSGPLRASEAMAKGASFQLFAMVLVNVCYRLHAEVEWNRGPNGEPAESTDGECAPHAFQDAFSRRLESGQWFYTPCLGWKEFAPDYVGPFGPETRVCETENHELTRADFRAADGVRPN